MNKKVETTENTQSTVDTQAEMLKVLKDLQDKVVKLEEENKRFSEKEKVAIEEAREEMITDEDIGPLWLDPKYKMEGYHYRATDLTRPDKLQKRLREGYEIARYSDVTDLTKSAVHERSNLTDAITVQLGTTRDTSGVWMRIPLEKYNKRQQVKERKNREITEAYLGDASNGAQFGEITIGSQTHYKKN
jgi:hypothetical protein